jgi:hypothetical protein
MSSEAVWESVAVTDYFEAGEVAGKARVRTFWRSVEDDLLLDAESERFDGGSDGEDELQLSFDCLRQENRRGRGLRECRL